MKWVKAKEYDYATGDEIVGTRGIESCIGLGIVEKDSNQRGLAHIFYEGNNKDKRLEECKINAEKTLNEFLGKFKLDNIKIAPVFLQLYDDDSVWKNSMYEFICMYLKNKGIVVPFKNINRYRMLKNGYPIFSKSLVMDNQKLEVQCKNKWDMTLETEERFYSSLE